MERPSVQTSTRILPSTIPGTPVASSKSSVRSNRAAARSPGGVRGAALSQLGLLKGLFSSLRNFISRCWLHLQVTGYEDGFSFGAPEPVTSITAGKRSRNGSNFRLRGLPARDRRCSLSAYHLLIQSFSSMFPLLQNELLAPFFNFPLPPASRWCCVWLLRSSGHPRIESGLYLGFMFVDFKS